MTEMKTLNGYEIVDEKARNDIEELKNKEVDLTGYATEKYVDTAVKNVSDTTQQRLAEIETAIPSLEGYAKESDIPTVPTNVSAFTNDAGYLTEHQSLEGLATENYVAQAITNIDIPEGTEVYTFYNKVWANFTDTDKEEVNYIVKCLATNKKVPTDKVYYFKSEYVSASSPIAGYSCVCRYYFNNSSIVLESEVEDGRKDTMTIHLDSYYKVYNVTFSIVNTTSEKDWSSTSVNSDRFSYYGNSPILKIIIRWKNEQYSSHEILTTSGNAISAEMGYYLIPDIYGIAESNYKLAIYNDSGSISVVGVDESGNTSSINDYTIVAYYEWG